MIQVSSLPPQIRGYDFEAFLNELFNAYGLSGRASFRLKGEQIDGSFVMHNEAICWKPSGRTHKLVLQIYTHLRVNWVRRRLGHEGYS